MCGIVGILSHTAEQPDLSVLARMSDRLSHRGSDGEGIWHDTQVAFGHRRLAIIDLSEDGAQPMCNSKKDLCLVYNGMLYNFQTLRAELEEAGHQFSSKSDTEVILKSYEAWGESCVERFNGMFAFAIWDKQNKKLFIARDRYGIKPLYFYTSDSIFIFASEIKAIVEHPSYTTSVCSSALVEYFSFQNLFSNYTLFEGIKMLPAGTTLSVSPGTSPKGPAQFWDYQFEEDHTLSEVDCVEEGTRLFEQAVHRQLVSDVELGAYLSGGMDSGSLTCVAAKTFPHLKSFTCGFDLSSASGLELAFDEREQAEFLSHRYRTEHYEVVLKAGDMERVMPELIWHLEDPRVGQCYPNYYVSRLASKFVKVVLAGTGGDELFAGYPWRYYTALVSTDLEHYIEQYYNYWQRLVSEDLRQEFFCPRVLAQVDTDYPLQAFRNVLAREVVDVTSPEASVNCSLYFEAKTFLHGLLVVEDKLSMAHGLETRVPFLDNDLVDFALKVPVKHKLHNLDHIVRMNENQPGDKKNQYFEKTNNGKLILRKIFERYVPRQYAQQRKQGFSAPDRSWFKGESIEYIKELLAGKNARIYDYLQPACVHALLEDHFSGRENRRLLIWSLLSFEWWLRTFMPK